MVEERTGIVEWAARAMERPGETRYDDVMVRSGTWGAVATSDLVRALVAALPERSRHDPLTRLPGRGCGGSAAGRGGGGLTAPTDRTHPCARSVAPLRVRGGAR